MRDAALRCAIMCPCDVGSLDSLALSLYFALASLLRPWEMRDGDDEERVTRISDTSKGIIPRQERRKNTKIPTCLDQGSVSLTLGIGVQISKEQAQESQVEREEQHEECDGRAKRAEQQDKRKDEPAGEEISECVVEVVNAVAGCGSCSVCGSVGFYDLESAWCEDDGEGKPETAVGRESCGAESVSYSHFPHASEQLDEATISESQSDDNLG